MVGLIECIFDEDKKNQVTNSSKYNDITYLTYDYSRIFSLHEETVYLVNYLCEKYNLSEKEVIVIAVYLFDIYLESEKLEESSSKSNTKKDNDINDNGLCIFCNHFNTKH